MVEKVKRTAYETGVQIRRFWNNLWELSVAVSMLVIAGWAIYTVRLRLTDGLDALMIVGFCASIVAISGAGALVRFLMNKT